MVCAAPRSALTPTNRSCIRTEEQGHGHRQRDTAQTRDIPLVADVGLRSNADDHPLVNPCPRWYRSDLSRLSGLGLRTPAAR